MHLVALAATQTSCHEIRPSTTALVEHRCDSRVDKAVRRHDKQHTNQNKFLNQNSKKMFQPTNLQKTCRAPLLRKTSSVHPTRPPRHSPGPLTRVSPPPGRAPSSRAAPFGTPLSKDPRTRPPFVPSHPRRVPHAGASP